VRGVEDERVSSDGQPLPAARPVGVQEAAGNDLATQFPARRQPSGDEGGSGGVPALVVAFEIGVRIAIDAFTKLLAHRMHGRRPLRRDFSDDLLGHGRHATKHDRPAGLDDARLLGRDQVELVAEHIAMVEADRSDHRDLRLHDVGGVEPSAQTHLDDANVHAPPCELEKGHGRHELEKTRMIVGAEKRRPLSHGPQFIGVGHDLLLAQQPAVHLHALAELDEVG